MRAIDSDHAASAKGKRLLGCLLAVALLLTAGWFLVFRVNRFRLEISLEGTDPVMVEYGSSYREPEWKVTLRGSLLWKDGIDVSDADITVDGTVRDDVLGKYRLTYTARYFGLQASAERTVWVVDTQCPQIELEELPEKDDLTLEDYRNAGFAAWDNYDGDVTSRVKRLESVGKIEYAVIDSSGNPGYAQRLVPDLDPVPPQLTLTGGSAYELPVGSPYIEPGYSAWDDPCGDLTPQVAVEGAVDWLTPGVYPVTYTVADTAGNTATATREVQVYAKPRPQIQWPEEKTVYLTFDDGPGPDTPRLLDLLDRYGVKATFFVTDSGYDDVMKQIVERGHSIGIHTVTHDYRAIYASPEAYFADLLEMQQIIYRNTGVLTNLMRFPGGSSNTVSRASCQGIMGALTKMVQDAGFCYFDWNVDSDDAGHAKTTKTVVRNVIDGIRENPVAAVLQHDIHGFSVEAVEQIIQWGLENGYTFQALTETSPGFHHDIQN